MNSLSFYRRSSETDNEKEVSDNEPPKNKEPVNKGQRYKLEVKLRISSLVALDKIEIIGENEAEASDSAVE